MYKFLRIVTYPLFLVVILFTPFIYLWVRIQEHVNHIKYKSLKDNPAAFNREFAIVIFSDMTRKYYFDEWPIIRDKIKKNYYDKGFCKLL